MRIIIAIGDNLQDQSQIDAHPYATDNGKHLGAIRLIPTGKGHRQIATGS